jgi:hypothetical protein
MENSNIILQKYHDLFNLSVGLLLDLGIKNTDVKSNVNKKCLRFMEVLEKKELDMDKTVNIIKKVFTIISNNLELLKNNNQELFSLNEVRDSTTVKITIIPGIDLEEVYNSITEEKNKKNMWLYLKSLYYASCKMIGISNDKNISDSISEYLTHLNNSNEIKINELQNLFLELYPNTTIVKKMEFNPFVGVGGFGGNNAEFNINDLLKNNPMPSGQTPSITDMTSMFGIDKMLNMDELSKHLKNINPDDIEMATEGITKLLGGNLDSGTSEMINSMLLGIKDELKKEDLAQGNPFNNIVKIAETVASQMIPKIEKSSVDMTKIWNSTKNLASNCVNENENPLFAGKGNPLSLLTGLMEKQMNIVNNPNNKKMQKEYLKEYNNLINSPNPMANILNMAQQAANNKNGKRNNKKK